MIPDAQLSQAPRSFLYIVESSLIDIVFVLGVQFDSAIAVDPMLGDFVAHVRFSPEAYWSVGLVELWDVIDGCNTVVVSRTTNSWCSWCRLTKTFALVQGT